MTNELNTVITMSEPYGRGIGNLTLENVRFLGRPNFSGERDRFKDTRRKCTVLIPEEHVEGLRAIGWNVKTTIPNMPDQEPLHLLDVFASFKFDDNHPGDVRYERGPEVFVIMGQNQERLTSDTIGMLDRTRLLNVDMEIRGWEYDPDEHPGAYSARLVGLVAEIAGSRLKDKYNLPFTNAVANKDEVIVYND